MSVPLGVRVSVQEGTTMSICVRICVCVSMCLGECAFLYISLWAYMSLYPSVGLCQCERASMSLFALQHLQLCLFKDVHALSQPVLNSTCLKLRPTDGWEGVGP